MTDILYPVNILSSFATDAYKAGHYLQLPPKSEASRFYVSPRKALRDDAQNYIVFGISYFIQKYLMKPLTFENIQESKKIWDYFNINGSSYPFPEKQLNKIVSHYNGYLPIKIFGVKEGQILNQYNTPVFIIEVTDPDLVWLPGFIETALQRSIWYPSTVGTISYTVRQIITEAYHKSVDEDVYDSLDFKLHDFGARGATSGESAALGGLAHLINFNSTDTMEAVLLGNTLYGISIPELACSIPASEHSTVTSWGSSINAEYDSLLNMIDICKKRKDKVFSFVSDSYDFYNMVDTIWGDPILIQQLKTEDLYPVVRPDSGDPIEVVLYALNSLSKSWGYHINSKGYKVLDRIRIIQGDGMSIDKIHDLLNAIINAGFSVENISYGMGGGLLQKLNRDSMSWAMKMYKIKVNGEWRDVRKQPSTQSDKKSFNPQNIVDDKDWVIHYQYDNNTQYPIIYKDNFSNIRNRVRNYSQNKNS